MKKALSELRRYNVGMDEDDDVQRARDLYDDEQTCAMMEREDSGTIKVKSGSPSGRFPL
jgi:hypothetical protein